MYKKFFLFWVATIVVCAIFASCTIDYREDENKYFIKNNTGDTIVVEYAFDSVYKVSDESRVVAPAEMVELSSTELRLHYDYSPSDTYSHLIVIANNDTIMNQNPIDDTLWGCEIETLYLDTDRGPNYGFAIEIRTWTLEVRK